MSDNISLESRIFDDYQKASKEGRKIEVSILRIIRAEIKNNEIQKKEKLTEEEIQKVLKSLLKKEEEALNFFLEGNRKELAEKTKIELGIIRKYLPTNLSLEEIEMISREIISKNNFEDIKDFNAAIKLIMKEAKGRADGKLVSAAISKILNK